MPSFRIPLQIQANPSGLSFLVLEGIDGGANFALYALFQNSPVVVGDESQIAASGIPLVAPAASIAIGIPVTGGNPNSILFIGPAGTLAENQIHLLFDPGTSTFTTTNIAVQGIVTFPDDIRQVFNPGATVAGLNVGAVAVDPSTPINGDLWYDSALNLLRARIGGASRTLGAGLAIGDTITGATAGSIFFAGAAGILAQDNANLFFDDALNQLQLAAGSAANPSLRIGGTAGNGLFTTGNNIGIATAGAESMLIAGSAFSLGAGRDVGFERQSAGVARITDGSTGIGSLRTKREVTARSTTPINLAVTESRNAQTNEGAGALIVINLPAAAAGLEFPFIVQNANGIQVTAQAGDTIRIAGAVSSAGGTATSTTIGDALILLAINATEWVAISMEGTGWVLA